MKIVSETRYIDQNSSMNRWDNYGAYKTDYDRGFKEGYEEGKKGMLSHIVRSMLARGLSLEEMSRMIDIDIQTIKSVVEKQEA